MDVRYPASARWVCVHDEIAHNSVRREQASLRYTAATFRVPAKPVAGLKGHLVTGSGETVRSELHLLPWDEVDITWNDYDIARPDSTRSA